ncbi:hypothetical protein JW935_01645, partial [candidate division KSB1 bacterium]|nr:hypothetical protein [candidate division KSB1 bacterium]
MTDYFLQFLSLRFWGALIVVSIFIFIFIVISQLLKKFNSGKFILILAFLPLGFLFILVNQYNFPVVVAVKYLIALVLFSGYTRTEKYLKVIYILGNIVFYLFLGGWVFLFYILLCILYELLYRKNYMNKISAGVHA